MSLSLNLKGPLIWRSTCTCLLHGVSADEPGFGQVPYSPPCCSAARTRISMVHAKHKPPPSAPLLCIPRADPSYHSQQGVHTQGPGLRSVRAQLSPAIHASAFIVLFEQGTLHFHPRLCRRVGGPVCHPVSQAPARGLIIHSARSRLVLRKSLGVTAGGDRTLEQVGTGLDNVEGVHRHPRVLPANPRKGQGVASFFVSCLLRHFWPHF